MQHKNKGSQDLGFDLSGCEGCGQSAHKVFIINELFDRGSESEIMCSAHMQC